MRIIIFFFFPVLVLSFGTLILIPVFADTISLDKQRYVFGEVISISGQVSYSEGQFIGLQILNPTKSDIVTIDQFLPKNNDGSFSKSYKAQGPKWNMDGIYTVKLVYDKKVYEESFQFKKQTTNEEEKESEEKTSTSVSNQDTGSYQTNQTTKSVKSIQEANSKVQLSDLKSRVQGFPDPAQAPNHYVKRYSENIEYKDWFDKTFPDYSVLDVVGYRPTHITGFPDNNNPPWHYVDRYNYEESYKDWFDSQFPGKSIYEVLGYSESSFQKIPNWIKNNAKWWSSGTISDSDFLVGIAYLINEEIIYVPNLSESESSSVISQNIPIWIKNTAQWWADDQINENEFLKSIQFLIENRIIHV